MRELISILFLISVILAIAANEFSGVRAFLNSNFSTAFLGAIGGSLTILFIQWIKDEYLFLSDINASIGILTHLSNTLLNIKEQHVLPLLKNYNENTKKFKENETYNLIRNPRLPPQLLKIEFHMERLQCPQLRCDIPTDRIFTMANKAPDFIQRIYQTKMSIDEVEPITKFLNEQYSIFRRQTLKEQINSYFGQQNEEGITDTTLPDAIKNFEKTIDEGLFFVKKSVDSLRKMGQTSLPILLRDKVAKSEIINTERMALMPPDNYIEGWE